MHDRTLEQLKFPIGRFTCPESISSRDIEQWISSIETFPSRLTAEVKDLSTDQLNWRYRPEGWTIKQVVHHCVDSHTNAYIRFKLALTEDEPTIRPYFEDRWAQLPDDIDDDISNSLAILAPLHERIGKVLRSMTEDQMHRGFIHPEHGNRVQLDENIGIYSWHGEHHLAHVKQALRAEGKYN